MAGLVKESYSDFHSLLHFCHIPVIFLSSYFCHISVKFLLNCCQNYEHLSCIQVCELEADLRHKLFPIFLSYFCHISVIFLSYLCHIFVILLSYSCHTPVILLSYFCHTPVICLSYSCHSSVIYMSYIYHILVTALSYRILRCFACVCINVLYITGP